MEKIESLTEEQISKFPEYVERWVRIGLSTEPANRSEAESGVRMCYEIAGLEPPKVYIWLRSPLEGVFGSCFLSQVGDQVGSQVWGQVWAQVWGQVWAQVGDQVRAQVWAQVGSQVGSQVWDQVRDQVRDQVWGQVWGQVWAQVGDQVRDQVWAQVWDQVRDQVGDQVRDQVWAQVRDQVGSQVRDQVWKACYGQHESGWISFYSFFVKELFSLDKILGLQKATENCGWWWAFDKAAILTERPTTIHRDDSNRLHSREGPALKYPDNFSLYVWHGVRVDQQIIESPHTQSLDQIKNESNEEIKRIRIERFAGKETNPTDGWRRYLKEVGAIAVDSRHNFVENTKECLMSTPDGMKILVCACPSTGRIYSLEVDPSMETCEQAQGYLWSGSGHVARLQKLGLRLNCLGRS